MKAEIRFGCGDVSISSTPHSTGIYEILRFLTVIEPLMDGALPPPTPAGLSALGEADRFGIVLRAASADQPPALQPSEGRSFLAFDF